MYGHLDAPVPRRPTDCDSSNEYPSTFSVRCPKLKFRVKVATFEGDFLVFQQMMRLQILGVPALSSTGASRWTSRSVLSRPTCGVDLEQLSNPSFLQSSDLNGFELVLRVAFLLIELLPLFVEPAIFQIIFGFT